MMFIFADRPRGTTHAPNENELRVPMLGLGRRHGDTKSIVSALPELRPPGFALADDEHHVPEDT
jgi:hypothetical protein